MIRVGLRFDERDVRPLLALAHRVRQRQLPGPQGGFAAAADAAFTGEPLILECSAPEEAQEMAAQFVLLGIRRPAIEELTGHRPAK